MNDWPRPDLDGAHSGFWTSLRDTGRLHLQRCATCRAWQHPPRPTCRACGGVSDLGWEAASGRGEVWSFTVCHPPVLAAFGDLVPYTVVVVRLVEGPFLVSRLVTEGPVAVGDEVTIVATGVADDLVLPLVEPA